MTDRRSRTSAVTRPVLLALAAGAVLAAGEASAGSNTSFSGTAYVDYWGVSSKEMARSSPTGVTIDAAIKMGVDINDDLTFSAKACFSCHGTVGVNEAPPVATSGTTAVTNPVDGSMQTPVCAPRTATSARAW